MACEDGGVSDDDSVHAASPAMRGLVSDDLALIERMLTLTPEQRLLGLAQAAAFFAGAKRA